jgi:lysyl-tRNA synthetase class 2
MIRQRTRPQPTRRIIRRINRVVPSTLIRSFQFDEASKTLLIVFQSGRRYRYLDVPAEIPKGLRAAFAKGAFFNAHIRDRFAYREEPAAR